MTVRRLLEEMIYIFLVEQLHDPGLGALDCVGGPRDTQRLLVGLLRVLLEGIRFTINLFSTTPDVTLNKEIQFVRRISSRKLKIFLIFLGIFFFFFFTEEDDTIY